MPFAADPSIDQGYAEFDALLRARYADPVFLLADADSFAQVDVEDVERVAAERFGDAADWSFSFSGDFEPAELIELVEAYIGSLPAGDGTDVLDFSEPPPPPGETVVEVQAGQGDTANVSVLFTAEASADRRDDIVAQVVAEVVGNRLTDFIREELGDSYSPFAVLDLGGGERPATELYISVSTGPDLVEDVSAAVKEQLAALQQEGPSDREFTNAVSTVAERLGFISNPQINDEVLDVLVDGAGNASFDDFVGQGRLISTVTPADVDATLDAWIDLENFIEVRVIPVG